MDDGSLPRRSHNRKSMARSKDCEGAICVTMGALPRKTAGEDSGTHPLAAKAERSKAGLNQDPYDPNCDYDHRRTRFGDLPTSTDRNKADYQQNNGPYRE